MRFYLISILLLLSMSIYGNKVDAQRAIDTIIKLIKKKDLPPPQMGNISHLCEGIGILNGNDYYIKEIKNKDCFFDSKTKKPISGIFIIWAYTNSIDGDLAYETPYSMDSGRFVKGYKQAIWVTKYLHENLLDYSISYRLGILHGKYTVYDTSGTIFYESNFVKGNGCQKAFYKDHTLADEGCFDNNKPQGVWRYYKTNGDRQSEILYNKGKQVQSKTFK